ncbi:MAG: Hsp20/alpha crystallin family protein, partial [Armatimonadetes bacterium]|nr:Hsp20/alpha crystallin family protein [Armatimonadota bacterium]
LDRMFEGYMPGFQLPMFRRREFAPFEMMRRTMPPVDIWETDDEVKLRLDVPGVEPKNIEIYTTENNICIKAEMKREEEEKTGGFYRMERRCGSFERSIGLPASVTPDQAKATFKHGVIEITLPKAEEAKRHVKKVEVQSEEEQMVGSKGGQMTQQEQQSHQSQQSQQSHQKKPK